MACYCILLQLCVRGSTRKVWACERGIVQVCRVTHLIQHCMRGIEPASVKLSGLQHVTDFCSGTTRGVPHVKCGPASVGVYRIVTRVIQHCARGIKPASSFVCVFVFVYIFKSKVLCGSAV
jgi:hypothetical protein